MNKQLRYMGLLLILVILSTAMSCATAIPKKESGQSLLLVMVETNIPSDTTMGIETYFEMTLPGNTKPMYIKSGMPFSCMGGFRQGRYSEVYVEQKTDSKGGGWTSSTSDTIKRSLRANFVLRPGEITIFPYKFYYKIEKRVGGQRHYYGMQKITSEDKLELYRRLKKDKNFSSWKSEFDTI